MRELAPLIYKASVLIPGRVVDDLIKDYIKKNYGAHHDVGSIILKAGFEPKQIDYEVFLSKGEL